eukprot:TRINITY_DN7136_c0_g1_i1.p1 TRINITY_DN7136_c0_g1~~TRINITY_DN7136_c0_g1_i1.p1  ORF type:complete len:531 (-),score=142.89 TRINITY_DN7136_c0_g1_i1:100-1692(-)
MKFLRAALGALLLLLHARASSISFASQGSFLGSLPEHPSELEDAKHGEATKENAEEHHAPGHDSPAHGHEHAEAGGHGGHAEHAAGEHHHRPSSEARSMSLALMGFVGFMMGAFYLVNFHDPDIRLGTWKMASMTISIFVSVLIYGMLKGLALDVLTLLGVAVTHGKTTIICLVLFLILYVMLQVVLFCSRAPELRMVLVAEGVIFAHVTGFAAMFGFAGLQEMHPFHGSFEMSLAVVGIAALALTVITFSGNKIRHAVEAREGASEDEMERYEENVEEAENDVFALTMGFIIMQVVRRGIVGHLPSFEPIDEPKGISQAQTWLLLCFGLGFGVLTVASSWVMNNVLKKEISSKRVIRYLSIAAAVNSMSMAWCLLFWADWQIYELGFDGERVSGSILIALLLTAVSFAGVFVLDFIADRLAVGHGARSVRSLVLALGILVGFAWEKSFDIAMEDVAHSGRLFGIPPTLTTYIMGIVLCVVVLPAWRWYILPKTVEEEAEKEPEESKGVEAKATKVAKKLPKAKSSSRAK